jgi:hypothetical protein
VSFSSIKRLNLFPKHDQTKKLGEEPRTFGHMAGEILHQQTVLAFTKQAPSTQSASVHWFPLSPISNETDEKNTGKLRYLRGLTGISLAGSEGARLGSGGPYR